MTKLLLIEDNLEMRENIAEILSLSNYNVLTAENGKVGIEMAKSHLPELIICDIMMPELDGYGVLRVLSRLPETAAIPFIFLTAKSEKTDFRKGMNLGADDYLTKPFSELDLIDAIELRLKKSRSWQHNEGQKGEQLDQFIEKATAESLDELAYQEKSVTYPKKHLLFMEGQYPHEVFFIKKGKVKLSKLNTDGKEYILDLLGEGDFMGHLAVLEESKHAENATVLEDAEIARIPRDSFLKLIHGNRDISAQFIKFLSNNIKEKEEKLLRLAYNSVRQRVADALLGLRKKYQEADSENFAMSISREDLASMVGTATESLIRCLSSFKSDQMVKIQGSQIEIVDPVKLERVAQRGF